tara:strand:+ start:562 stop:1263 length:702 start_codon:yes stop_codon:yes gene_type:complete
MLLLTQIIIGRRKTLKAIILAAGRGNRLRPLTDKVPKPLTKINGEPLIERHVKRLSESSFEEIVINLSYKGDQIEKHIGDGTRYGIRVKYSKEGDQPLETLGGILKALPILGEVDQFVVINSDIWTDYPIDKLPKADLNAHIVLAPKSDLENGDFDLQQGLVQTSSSPPFMFTGIASYKARLFKGMVTEKKKLGPILRVWAKQKKLSGEIFLGKWFDIGTTEKLRNAVREIKK